MRKYLAWAVVLIVITGGAIWVYPSLAAASDGAPSIPHGTSGYEHCLSCHGATGIKPVPASHTSFDESSCWSCHVAPPPLAPLPGTPAPTPIPTPTPTPTPSPAPTPASPGNSYCFSCHGQSSLSMSFADGEKLSLYVNSGIYAVSIHGDKLLCTDCHRSITTYPHPKIEYSGQREYNVAQYELCKRCHFANYTKTLDSIHFQLLSSGNLNAPICTDCHGAHDVNLPSQPRTKISQTCSKCHLDIFEVYAGSVHGNALIQEDNYDVPVCTDCHTSHTIEDPRTAAFRFESVKLCSNCHGNRDLMQKYGISTNVVKSYLNDFHGRTVALIGEQDKDIRVPEAVCTDCHGVHDIQQVDNPNSPVIKANLLNTCRKCHPDATTNFPGAWLSHYEPSITQAPLVFFVKWFYKLLIPFIIAGLSVHILLDLWRKVTNR